LQLLEREHWAELGEALGHERCCSLHASHVVATGCGRIWVDRWPAPRATAAFTGGNLGLAGHPGAFDPDGLAFTVGELLSSWDRVFIDPGPSFGPLLRRSLDGLRLWPRVLYALRGGGTGPPAVRGVQVRPLRPDDADAIRDLHPSIAWISDTRGGPEAVARSDRAVGAFVGDLLASVAVVFYEGSDYEELGVVTDPGHRGRGLSPRCAAALVDRIRARGRVPCWSTTPDNGASRRVAEKLGFTLEAEQLHFVAGQPVTGSLPLG